jgi:hypothetical protein
MAGEDDPPTGPRKVPKFRGIIFGVVGGEPQIDPEVVAAASVDYGPGFDETFQSAVDGARELKAECVSNGPADLPVLATAILAEGAFMLPVQEMVDGSGLRPPDALEACLTMVSGMFGPAIAVIICLETLWVHIDPANPKPPLVQGELSGRWDDGDREGISEALVVTCATATQFRTQFLPYHYGDGSVVWDEGQVTDVDDWLAAPETGNVERALKAAFRQKEGGTDGTG